jgi:hypothetical protein
LVKVLGRWLSDAGGYVFATMGGGASKEQQAELYKKKEVAWIERIQELEQEKLEALKMVEEARREAATHQTHNKRTSEMVEDLKQSAEEAMKVADEHKEEATKHKQEAGKRWQRLQMAVSGAKKAKDETRDMQKKLYLATRELMAKNLMPYKQLVDTEIGLFGKPVSNHLVTMVKEGFSKHAELAAKAANVTNWSVAEDDQIEVEDEDKTAVEEAIVAMNHMLSGESDQVVSGQDMQMHADAALMLLFTCALVGGVSPAPVLRLIKLLHSQSKNTECMAWKHPVFRSVALAISEYDEEARVLNFNADHKPMPGARFGMLLHCFPDLDQVFFPPGTDLTEDRTGVKESCPALRLFDLGVRLTAEDYEEMHTQYLANNTVHWPRDELVAPAVESSAFAALSTLQHHHPSAVSRGVPSPSCLKEFATLFPELKTFVVPKSLASAADLLTPLKPLRAACPGLQVLQLSCSPLEWKLPASPTDSVEAEFTVSLYALEPNGGRGPPVLPNLGQGVVMVSMLQDHKDGRRSSYDATAAVGGLGEFGDDSRGKQGSVVDSGDGTFVCRYKVEPAKYLGSKKLHITVRVLGEHVHGSPFEVDTAQFITVEAPAMVGDDNVEVSMKVIRGPKWTYGDQDGGEGCIGTVIAFRTSTGSCDGLKPGSTPARARVRWANGKEDYFSINTEALAVQRKGEHVLLNPHAKSDLLSLCCSAPLGTGAPCDGDGIQR